MDDSLPNELGEQQCHIVPESVESDFTVSQSGGLFAAKFGQAYEIFVLLITYGPRRDKTCLRGLAPKGDSNHIDSLDSNHIDSLDMIFSISQ